MKIGIYQITDSNREIHMMGNYVGVCFRTEVKRVASWDDSRKKKTIVETWEKEEYPMPYIDFVNLREDIHNEGSFYVDEDSSVSGGISENQAKQIAEELMLAYNYVKGREWE